MMEIALTRMSQNGQIVIPAEIRRDAAVGPATKFLVINRGGDILLKKVNKKSLEKEFMVALRRSEEDVKRGRVTKVKSFASAEGIDSKLMQ